MTDRITDILNEVCGSDTEIYADTELIDSGILDSLAFIELLSELEDIGIEIQPTQYPREAFRTARHIAEIADKASK